MTTWLVNFSHFKLFLRFSFCQFPFILSTVVKKAIIQRDSEQQMISQARVRPRNRDPLCISSRHSMFPALTDCVRVSQQSLVTKVSRRQRVDMNLLFLNIKVRRAQLLSDSLDEVGTHGCFTKDVFNVRIHFSTSVTINIRGRIVGLCLSVLM